MSDQQAKAVIDKFSELSFDAAVAALKSQMKDTFDEMNPATLALGMWASKRLAWADVAVAKNETSVALVMKDSEEEAGKRMCASGMIIEIAVQKIQGHKLAVGLLITNARSIVRFVAAGSSGALVANSGARFCGVVTGKFDYGNSAGGTGHGIQMVGMFDLKENKTK